MNFLRALYRRLTSSSQPSRTVTVDPLMGDFVDGESQYAEPVISIVRRQGAAKHDDEFRGWMLEFELKRYRDESAWWADLLRVEGNCDA